MTDKFNENLKKARQNANMTQEEVAVKIGVAKNTYCNWELGKREPDIMKIRLLKYTRIKTIILQLYQGNFLQIFFLNEFYRQSLL
jgi:transcriptional regulator with XRE-family HTH domain